MNNTGSEKRTKKFASGDGKTDVIKLISPFKWTPTELSQHF